RTERRRGARDGAAAATAAAATAAAGAAGAGRAAIGRDRERAVEPVAGRAQRLALAVAVLRRAARIGAPAVVEARRVRRVSVHAHRAARALDADLAAAGGPRTVDFGVAGCRLR